MSNPDAAVELETFLQHYPGTRMIETLNVDANGILRGKRIARDEFRTLYEKGIKVCRASTLLDVKGGTVEELGLGSRDGDPGHVHTRCRACWRRCPGWHRVRHRF